MQAIRSRAKPRLLSYRNGEIRRFVEVGDRPTPPTTPGPAGKVEPDTDAAKEPGGEMANNDASERNLIRLPQGGEVVQPDLDPGATILLGGTKALDLSGLTEPQRQALIYNYAEGLIVINKKGQELVTDAGALNHTLGTMAHHTNEVAAAGNSITITHTQDTSLGRTEIIMGTSEAAKKGKLSRTQTGGPDHTILFAVVAVVIVALLVLAMGR